MSTTLYAVVDPSTGELVKEYPTATDARSRRPWPPPPKPTANGHAPAPSPTARR